MKQRTININTLKSGHFSEYLSSARIYELEDETSLFLNPEGHIEMIFQLDGDFEQKSTSSSEWKTRPTNFIGGLHSKSFHIRASNGKGRLLSICFKPHKARHFIPDRLNLYKNQIVEFDAIGMEIGRIEETASNNKLIQGIEQGLSNWYLPKQSTIISHALELMESHCGFIAIEKITEKLNISNSHFRLRFNEEVGMSPKEYSKILRIKYITKLMSANPELKLTQLAHSLNYFDQAHFNHDFKSVTGLSPGQYRSSLK